MTDPDTRFDNPVHGVALALAIDPDGPLAGVLLLGPPGGRKSSLAIAAIELCPWRRTSLVADDAVLITEEQGRLVARAPEAIAGRIELYGAGPVAIRWVRSVALRAALTFADRPPRLVQAGYWPDEGDASVGRAVLPNYPFDPARPFAAAHLRLLVRSILGGQT